MIFFSAHTLELISTAAETAFPDECCGLLVGHSLDNGNLIVTRLKASPNLTQCDKSDSFEVDPKLRFDLMRELNGGPERIIGHYHSHPGGSAEPSDRDLEMACEPELVWLITSVIDSLAVNTSGWYINKEGGYFNEVIISTHADK